jgi:hypothetical protein
VLPALALLVVAYMATSTFVFTAIRDHRDHRLGVKMMTDDEMTQHPLFHTAYIGLGYLHNDFGIRFKDGVASARVQSEDPGTVYMSHRYETIIRRAYFSFLEAHPLEALRQYAAKAVVAVADTGPYLLLVLLTMPAMLLLDPGRGVRRLLTLLTLPALLVGYLQPMVAIPGSGYDAELFGVLGVLGILGICWVLGHVESRARQGVGLSSAFSELRAAWSTQAGQESSLGRSMRISVATITVLVIACTGGYFIRQSAFRWQGTYPSEVLRYLGSVSSDVSHDA